MGIKDKVRNSLSGPISLPTMTLQSNDHNSPNGNHQQQDTNYFVQLDSKYDYPTSPTHQYQYNNGYDNKTPDGYDIKGPDFAYPAEYNVSHMPYGGGAGETMQFGQSDGMGGFGGDRNGGGGGGEESDEFSEYLGLMVYFRERDWNVTLRKIDWRLLPPYLFAYLLAFMDRGNVGNAKVAGLLKTINMTDVQYNTGVASFFVLYILLEVPSQYFLKKIGPKYYLSGLLFGCGVVMASGAAIQSPIGFIMMRLALGATESGLMPGFNASIAKYYTRDELSVRIAIFFASASISGAFSGLLAFGLAKLGGVAGLESWRWIWLLEGSFTAFVGVIAPFVFVDTPENAGSWLTHEEKRYLVLRQRYGAGSGGVARSEAFTMNLLVDLAKNWQTYPMILIYISHSVLGYAISFSLPPLMKTLGYSNEKAYLIPVPIFLAACVLTILNSWWSDRRESRFLHIAGPFSLAIVGVALTIPTAGQKDLVGLSILGLICLTFAAYLAVPISISWMAANTVEPHRSIAIALQISAGGIGGLAGSFIYLDSEAPQYPTGYYTSGAIALVAIISCIVLKVGYARVNRQRNQLTREEIESNWTEEKLAVAGDKNPHFRYIG